MTTKAKRHDPAVGSARVACEVRRVTYRDEGAERLRSSVAVVPHLDRARRRSCLPARRAGDAVAAEQPLEERRHTRVDGVRRRRSLDHGVVHDGDRLVDARPTARVDARSATAHPDRAWSGLRRARCPGGRRDHGADHRSGRSAAPVARAGWKQRLTAVALGDAERLTRGSWAARDRRLRRRRRGGEPGGEHGFHRVEDAEPNG